MGSLVDIEIYLLIETPGTVLDCALISFLAALGASVFLDILLREFKLTRVSRTICSSLGRSLYARRGTRDTYHRSTLIYR
jgi:hypothetical protein